MGPLTFDYTATLVVVRVFELWHRLKLLLGATHHGMIGSPVIRVGAAGGRGCRCGAGVRGRRGSARGGFARRSRGRSSTSADRFLDEFKLVHGNGDVVLTHTQKAADSDNHGVDLAVLIQDQLIDVAEFFIGFVVDVEAHELGRAPVVLEHHLFGICGRSGRGRCSAIRRLSLLGIGRATDDRSAQKRDSNEILHRNPPKKVNLFSENGPA